MTPTQFYRRTLKAKGHIGGLSAQGPYHLIEWADYRKRIAEIWVYQGDSLGYQCTKKEVFDAGECCAMYKPHNNYLFK